MIKTVEAIVDEKGNVKLLEQVRLGVPRRALVTILDEKPGRAYLRVGVVKRGGAGRGLESHAIGRSVVPPATGAVVLVKFPFSDLSRSKLRRRTCRSRRGAHVLCQVTSKPHGDSSAVKLEQTDFASGSLAVKLHAIGKALQARAPSHHVGSQHAQS